MTECCGEERDTPFCPICGRQLTVGYTLHQLIAYCRQHQKQREKELRRLTDSAEPSPVSFTVGNDRDERRMVRIRHAQQFRDKWKSWADQIESLMQRDGSQ
jgi:hypothetical protein